jgi:hypothetical protein
MNILGAHYHVYDLAYVATTNTIARPSLATGIRYRTRRVTTQRLSNAKLAVEITVTMHTFQTLHYLRRNAKSRQ